MRKIVIFIIAICIISFSISKNMQSTFYDIHNDIIENIKHFSIKFNENKNIKLKKIELINLKNLDGNELLNKINVNHNKNIFKIDLKQIRDTLMKENERDSIKIKRDINGIITIDIVEKIPLMIWEHNNKKNIIDYNGTILNFKKFNEKLPIVKGMNANMNIKKLHDIILKKKIVRKRLKYAEYIENYRWDLYLKNDLLIQLPDTKLFETINILEGILLKKSITEINYNVIDMRINDRIFFRF